MRAQESPAVCEGNVLAGQAGVADVEVGVPGYPRPRPVGSVRTADDRGGARQEEEATAQNAAAALAGRRAVRHGHPNSEYEEEEEAVRVAVMEVVCVGGASLSGEQVHEAGEGGAGPGRRRPQRPPSTGPGR